ncbi:MAG: cyclic-di-AMP receptor [Acutalibacteraceae bacterium]
MKMIYAIVYSEDDECVTEELNKNRFSVTKLSTTGGFLRKGNTTLMIVTDDDKTDEVISIIKANCAKRQQVNYSTAYMGTGMQIDNINVLPSTIDVGGATIFVVNVEHFEKV